MAVILLRKDDEAISAMSHELSTMSHDCVILSAAKNLDCYAHLRNQALLFLPQHDGVEPEQGQRNRADHCHHSRPARPSAEEDVDYCGD